jgi:hypothetical protein
MLRSLKEISGYRIHAIDGDIGKVHDFLFDDEIWTIRYVVVDTGTWLSGRKVLIVPSAVERPEWETQTLFVNLMKDQVKDSPEIDADKPVSRQAEVVLHQHFDWAPYWIVPSTGITPPIPPELESPEEESVPQQERVDPHLRSMKEVMGYNIQAPDGKIGQMDQFIIDDKDWFIRYMVVDIRTRLIFWKRVLVSQDWIERVSWANSTVYVDLPKELIKNSPEYDPAAPVNREYEERLYDYYGRPKYWK